MKKLANVLPGRGGYYRNLDILKGIGIILMVLGHSGFPFTNFIYLFHMAIFFMVSGYCWNNKKINNNEEVRRYIWRKVKKLYFPFVVCNVSFLVFTNSFIKIGIYTDNPCFFELVGNEYTYPLFEALSVKEFAVDLFKILIFYGTTQLGGATWFLRTLFFVEVGHCLLEYIITKLNVMRRPFIIGFAFFLCVLASELHRLNVLHIPGIFMIMILGYIVYVVGILLRYLNEIGLNLNQWWIAMIAMICLMVCNQFGSISISQTDVTNTFFYLLVSLCGWLVVMFASNLIDKTKLACAFAYLGKHTMPIIILHFLCFKIVTYIYYFGN